MAEQPIQHHTVPAGYLRGFASPATPMLVVQTRDGKRYRKRPEELAVRRHYHSVRNPDGTIDPTPEIMSRQMQKRSNHSMFKRHAPVMNRYSALTIATTTVNCSAKRQIVWPHILKILVEAT